ncbi:MAG: DUF4157 domain-containing protein [Kofleriaceae bacterium]
MKDGARSEARDVAALQPAAKPYGMSARDGGNGGIGNMKIGHHVRAGGDLAGFPGAPLDNQRQQAYLDRLGPGQPLSQSLASELSSLYRHDLSSVRVHPDAKSAAEMNARAFTIGAHIAVAPGEPNPESANGKKLVAHELAHVVQQSRGQTGVQGHGLGRDSYEAEADAAADAVVTGRAVPRLSAVRSGVIQRQDKPQADQGQSSDKKGDKKAPTDPNAHPSLTDQYPYLLGLLAEEDMVALEAASETRYSKLRPKGAEAQPGDKPTKALGKTSISVPLNKLLSPEARYVDVSSWDTIYGVLRGHGAPELVGGLLRNEMMRRFLTNNGLSGESLVDIKLDDPDGKKHAPSHLLFEIAGTRFPTTLGQITPTNLKEVLTAFRLEDAVGTVGDEANKVAMEVALIEEEEKRNGQVQDRVKDQAARPQSHSPTELRALAARLASDKQAATDMAAKAGYVAPGAENLAATFGGLLDDIDGALAAQKKWLAEHHTMPTDAEMYEEDGTWLVTQGSKQWDKGGAHKIVSGLAYTGAVAVAIADGLGNLFSFGYQNDEGTINEAYNAGQISWDERTDLEFSALGRAAAVGIVTVAVTVATAGLGTEAALGLGLARGTFAYGAVVVTGGALSGTLVTASSLGTKSLVTGVGDFSGPNAQSIWKAGMPSATEWKWGLAMGAGVGALAALPNALPGPSGMVVPGGPRPVQTINVDGFDIDLSHDLAVGTHPDGRVAFIRPSGGGIYKPGPGGLLIPLKEVGEGGVPRSMIVPDVAGPVVSDAAALPGNAGSTSLVPYQPGANAMVPYRPGASAMVPYGANAAPILVLDANAAGQVPIVWNGQPMMLGPNSDILPPPTPMTYPGATGDEVVSSFLRAKQLSGATTPDSDVVNTLMREYGTTLPAPSEPTGLDAFDLFGLKSSQSQFPQLTAGPQPFGFLPAAKQPFGLLAGAIPEVYDLNPSGSYLPQVAAGTAPKFTSTTLGKNIMESYGLPRSTSFSGWQPHHILVKELAQMPQMKDLAINLDDPTNGIMMPERATFRAGSGTIMPHEGYHSIYSAAMKEAVGKIDPTLPASVREIKLFNLQHRARAALQSGAPLYERDGATIEGWRALLDSK